MHSFGKNLALWWTVILALWLGSCTQSGKASPTPVPSPSATVALEPAMLITPEGSASSTPIPLPTEPPPTPTPTATPVIYLVQSGDTLLGIAIQHNVSLDALLLVNPGIRPELLQIGQSVTIPAVETAEAGPNFVPTPTPVPLTIQGVGFYRTPVGGLWCLGEVLNPTSSVVQNVRVAATLFDIEGTPITLDNLVAGTGIPPGRAVPFGVLFADYPADLINQQVTLRSSEIAPRPESWHPSLLALDLQGNAEGAVYRVQGTIRNDGVEAASQVLLLITLYDNEGRVTGFGQETLAESLPTGAQQQFDVRLSPASPHTSRFSVLASGRIEG